MDARLVDEMRRVHRVHTLLLYGSHARGDATPESDIDVAGFADVSETVRDARVFEGTFLDGFVYPTSTLTAPPDPDLLKLRGARALLDERQLVGAFLSTLDALERAGPKPLPETELRMRRVWARKMLQRIRKGDIEAHYRRHWLLYQLLEDHFALKGEWYRGPKLALASLEPPLRLAFERALQPAAPLEALDELVGLIVG